jgi:3-hydroxyacyl-[acyl-carrier-protein] dehydratase
MKCMMDVQEIMKYLPHRHPFLLIDRIIEMEMAKSVIAIKNVTINEAFFNGHFPNRPVMPGVLILEAMAQAAGVLAYKSTNTTADSGVLYYFAAIDNVRFRRIVEPGDQLRLEVLVLRHKRDMWKLKGSAYVGEDLACSGEFMSARKKVEVRD